MLKIGVIGTGYWGKHHLRIFSDLPCQLVGIADIDKSKKTLADKYRIKFFSNFHELLPEVDAVSIVTPPASHFTIAQQVLQKRKHVLLEKPFVKELKQAYILKDLARKNNLTLMAGHTYLHHPAIVKLKELIRKKSLGNIYYLLFQWLNLGIIRSDVNALWNFAPHPFSILYYLIGLLPEKISVSGKFFIQKNIEDVIFMNLHYPHNILVQINLSWLHPIKIREMSLVGSQKLAVFDDTKLGEQLKIYDKGINAKDYLDFLNWENFTEFHAKIKYGSEEIIPLEETEPLYLELKDFCDAIKEDTSPRSGADSAIYVLKLLQAADRSLTKGGEWIEINN